MYTKFSIVKKGPTIIRILEKTLPTVIFFKRYLVHLYLYSIKFYGINISTSYLGQKIFSNIDDMFKSFNEFNNSKAMISTKKILHNSEKNLTLNSVTRHYPFRTV